MCKHRCFSCIADSLRLPEIRVDDAYLADVEVKRAKSKLIRRNANRKTIRTLKRCLRKSEIIFNQGAKCETGNSSLVCRLTGRLRFLSNAYSYFIQRTERRRACF